MPDDCIVFTDLKGKIEENSRDKLLDLYSETSHLETFGKHESDGALKQSVEYPSEYQAPSEDLGSSNEIADVGGAFYDLFS